MGKGKAVLLLNGTKNENLCPLLDHLYWLPWPEKKKRFETQLTWTIKLYASLSDLPISPLPIAALRGYRVI